MSPRSNRESSTWLAVNIKKHVTSISCRLAPAIWSRVTGQQIPCFDRCQLIIIWMSNIKDIHGKPRLYREIKFDVTWPYVKRQTAKMTSEFVFFSSNPSLNHIKIEKCPLLFATNTNIFTLLFKEVKTDGKSFVFAVCRLT